MVNTPLVSVIIPVYNGERYLAEAIESVLVQTYRPIEIIVVDDGSTDGSAEIANRFGSLIRYQFQPNGGIGAARNRGIGLAQGSFFAFLDADDLWVQDKLTRQMEAFAANAELDMIFGHVKQFYSPELDGDVTKQMKIPVETMPGYHAGTMLIKQGSFLHVGLFRTDWHIGEFLDWHARAVESGLKSLMLPAVVMKRRLHKANQGVYKREHRMEYVHVLKAMLDRRRIKSDAGEATQASAADDKQGC